LKKHIRFILAAVCVLLLCIAGCSGYYVYSILSGYEKARSAYTDIRQEYVSYADSTDSLGSNNKGDVLASAESSPLKVDFDNLKESVNPEICAWIWCEDTVIDYPVVQHSDNEYYLNTNAKGESSATGAIFLDTANFSDFRDTNNILHGHHMGDGTMFASLDKWQDESYFKEHPVMYLNTPSGNYCVEIFAAFTTAAGSEAYRFEFSGLPDIQNWIEWIRRESVIKPDIELFPGDHFLTLSTCAYSYEDARSVLIGRFRTTE